MTRTVTGRERNRKYRSKVQSTCLHPQSGFPQFTSSITPPPSPYLLSLSFSLSLSPPPPPPPSLSFTHTVSLPSLSPFFYSMIAFLLSISLFPPSLLPIVHSQKSSCATSLAMLAPINTDISMLRDVWMISEIRRIVPSSVSIP